ncbi:hypothetical protein PoB_000785300 [Plakobranchus ocellatus]|uniref:DDE Tnp4 domain-containing protein n=1 Tax=Plakobranchus ocellatus TaxID=259542 RepID=A0AAV3YFU6_9GAST|nr:hypothetical protein PoB_000785300 [Plakobranchus ocellatus]
MSLYALIHAFDIEDPEDLLVYYSMRKSKNNFETGFSLENTAEDEAWEMFRFKRADINRLRVGLLIPDHIITTNRLNISGISSRNQRWIPKQALADAVAAKGAPIQNCIGFIDGTIRPIARPSSNQRSCYSGHKRLHGLIFQRVMPPNGIIGHMFGPMEGKRHDSALLSIAELETIGDFYLYGDQAYSLRRTLISPFRGAALSPQEQEFNKAMGKLRVCVEWGFGEIIKH